MSEIQDALDFADCAYLSVDGSVVFPEADQKLQETIKTALQEQAEREKGCEGCTHKGLYENEFEYGLPSPCTGCKRRAIDRYQTEK